jgi:PIN domain nuclease of toxin-antitoxin system
VSGVVLDTHTAIWYLVDSGNLSSHAGQVLDETIEVGEPLYLATISVVEMVYLVEKGRLSHQILEIIYREVQEPSGCLVPVPLHLGIASHLGEIPRSLVPDLPDRVIAATALYLGIPLVTRDAKIRSLPIATIW